MEKYSFFNSEVIDGIYDRTYRAEDFASYFASFVGNGVFGGGVNSLKAVQTGEKYVSIMPGKAFINGYYYENTESFNVYFGNEDTKILLRLDLNERMISVVTGAELVRTQNIYDLQLATIENGVVYDNRFNRDVCGTVVAAVQEIDVSTVYEEFKQRFEDILSIVDTNGILGVLVELQTQCNANDVAIHRLEDNFEWKTLTLNHALGDTKVSFPAEWNEIYIVGKIPTSATNSDIITATIIKPVHDALAADGMNVQLDGFYDDASLSGAINIRYNKTQLWVHRITRNGTWYNTQDINGFGAGKWSAYYR